MCGLAGIFTARGLSQEALRSAVTRMAAPIAHRGPDDSGAWLDAENGIALGFRRLAIIDLSEQGHQPMLSASGRYVMTFNGEVYNHAELRRELETARHHFRGHSDSEVILAGFERWGIDIAVRRFVGMFAIALWDCELRQLHLIRDRLGIKPLFVFHRPGIVLFGSELKALVAGPGFERALDPAALTAYLRYLYVPAPRTIYRNVFKLLPGHILTVGDVTRTLAASRPYWSVEEVAQRGSTTPFTGTDTEAISQGEQLLLESTRLRMQADVPLGAFLSGGIDSSTIVALMQVSAHQPVKTFTIGFDVGEHNEAPHAARVAKHLGTEHTELMVTADDALNLVPRLPEMFDEPLADPSQLPTFLVSQMARREVTVALSGDGGDEVFGGYNRYTYGERVLRRTLRTPALVRRLVAAGIDRLSPDSWDKVARATSSVLPKTLRHRLPGEKLHKISRLLRADTPADMYRSLLSAWQEPETLVVGAGRLSGVLDRVMGDGAKLSLVDQMMLVDQVGYLADDLLAKVDRASMAVSLEVRVPILDHRVVEFAWQLPRAMKIRNGQGKWLLRQILYRYVPPALVDRPKVGFSVPIDSWLRGALRPWGDDLLASGQLDRSDVLRPDRVREAWRRFQSGRGGTGLGLWAVLVFRAWEEHWLGGVAR